jgi:TolA-binding protein
MKKLFLPAISASLLLVTTLGAQTSQEEFARRQYESGLSFMQNKRYTEALKDFQAVVDSFPKSAVADDALLQIATYHVETSHDVMAARTAIDRLLKDYPDADAAPMAYVIAGRLAISTGQQPKDVDVALASFERVPRLFPTADAVPAAGYFAGEALRTVRRMDEALDRYNRVTMEYPRSVWAARATIAGATFLVQSDRGARVLENLQRVRQQFPGTPEAALALDYNSIIFRLYVRTQSPPVYSLGKPIGETARFKDVVGIRIDDRGQILVGHKQGVTVFDPKGTVTRTVPVEEPSTFFVDDRGMVVATRKDMLIVEKGQNSALAIPPAKAGDKPRQVEEIPSAVARPDGTWLLADRKGKAVIKVSAPGSYAGTFAAVNAERLAINWTEDVAMIDRDSKGIVILDRDGKPLSKIPQRGTGYEFNDPVDLAFDALGHLYVLDRGKGSIFVFGAKNRLVTTISFPDKEPGNLQKAQALSLDRAGRMYVFDDRSQRVQVYQ